MPVAGTTFQQARDGLELLVELDRAGARPLRAQLEDALRDAVRSRRLPAGAALPASRTLAADLGVSRRLVVEGYAQLVAEGYLVARRGAGTFVAPTARPPATDDDAAAPVTEPRPARFDFFAGAPDLTAFPRAAWTRAVRDALRTLPAHALGYGDPRGAAALRVQLAAYLGRARGVVADPQRMVIVSGAAQGLALLAGVLAARGTPNIAVEDPGLELHREILRRHGGQLTLVPVDDEGLRVDLLRESGAGAVVVTAAHQMPRGVALSVRRRAELIDWGGLVVEDDYDAEFRYDRAPLGALQGLAPERVVYLGSASKTLGPGLRLGWMVVPHTLIDELATEKLLADSGSDAIGQHALARMIETGSYDRQIRVLRRRHRARRDACIAALARHVPGARPLGIAAGLHVVVALPHRIDPERFAQECEARGVRVYFPTPRALVLGYASIAEPSFDEAFRLMAQALRVSRSG
jgi:GntR family transcriptional regulator / MocR family aminotransferase